MSKIPALISQILIRFFKYAKTKKKIYSVTSVLKKNFGIQNFFP